MKECLSIDEAFVAMREFIEAYSRRCKDSEDIAILLSNLNLLDDGSPADPVMRDDFKDAVEIALSKKEY